MVDQFYFETLGVTYASIIKSISPYRAANQLPLTQMETLLYKLIAPHIRGQWLNPPRRRRHLVNSLLDWHRVYDMTKDITRTLEDTPLSKSSIVMHLPKVPLIWRLGAIREIVLSGFQLELFSLEERPFAYYYASQVTEEHLSCLDDLLLVVAQDSSAHEELKFQHNFLTALQLMFTATFV
ncbi:hypothetical protein H0H93_000232, partial [Arthromyces matolae]